MFRTVLPLIESNKLPVNPKTVGMLWTGQRALIYPAIPVMSNKAVWSDLTSGKYFLFIVIKLDLILFITVPIFEPFLIIPKYIK